jgi:hypothetical protein
VGRATLQAGGRLDLDALDDATAQAKAMVAELERARAELDRVGGG